jgi:hypothetical protein
LKLLFGIVGHFASNNTFAKQEVLRKGIERAVTVCGRKVGWISTTYTNNEKWGGPRSGGSDLDSLGKPIRLRVTVRV